MTQSGDGPESPLTQLQANAAEHHETFTAWVDAGFTRGEALQMLIAVLQAGIAATIAQQGFRGGTGHEK